MKPKIVLAYSGGLDTSVMLKWLAKQGYDVVAFVADVGQNEDFEAVKRKALATGASKVVVKDLKKDFVEKFVFHALKAGAVYEGQYLLGTSIARPLIAKTQVEVAKKEGTNVLGHGCTGKGNDQVRFELTWAVFMPDVEVISPWKDDAWLSQFEGRSDLIRYAKRNGIPVSASLKKPYSTDENIAHTSYESGVLEDAAAPPDEKMFKGTVSPLQAPDKETKISVSFDKGVPVSVQNFSDGVEVKGGLELFKYLNKIGGRNGVGRIDIVENRFVGIKSRGVYEAPAATILWKAHKDLESVTLDREVAHLKERVSPLVAKLIYNG
ncbi:MAG: argininosuccinate synthase, partial [Candidatus Micrarchaeota archaeon]